jgi:hypothetical protein
MPTTRDARTFAAERFGVELDGRFAGWASAAAGGGAYGVLTEQDSAPDEAGAKRILGVRYEDIEIQFGARMGPALYEWLEQTLAQTASPRNGAILGLDFGGHTLSRLEFFEGSVSGVGFPSLDAGARKTANLTVKITPSRTKHQWAGEVSGTAPLPPDAVPVHRPLMRSNFRLQIDGLDCSKVSSVGALAVRTADRQQSTPNLSITLPQAGAESFYRWYEGYSMRGESSPEGERAGMLEFLSPDLQSALITLTIGGLGIFRVAAISNEPGTEEIRRVRAEMYCTTLSMRHSF